MVEENPEPGLGPGQRHWRSLIPRAQGVLLGRVLEISVPPCSTLFQTALSRLISQWVTLLKPTPYHLPLLRLVPQKVTSFLLMLTLPHPTLLQLTPSRLTLSHLTQS